MTRGREVGDDLRRRRGEASDAQLEALLEGRGRGAERDSEIDGALGGGLDDRATRQAGYAYVQAVAAGERRGDDTHPRGAQRDPRRRGGGMARLCGTVNGVPADGSGEPADGGNERARYEMKCVRDDVVARRRRPG